ncbi:MAG: hypothetical protein COB04_01420 [Gammaproteobacteria bacterium]|nr:MAG: hypothetical protein COB04_01420 [Gammaproteobacteria bacterium]
MKYIKSMFAGATLALAAFTHTAQATEILCSDPSLNNVTISDSFVSSCLGSGVGNINGNPANDAFLLLDNSWTFVSKVDGSGNVGDFGLTYTQQDITGTTPKDSEGDFSFDASFWDTNDIGAIGFKFGTGNEPDEWFVFELNDQVTSGHWFFDNVLVPGFNKKGNGLSHINLYSREAIPVSEPGMLILMLLGLSGMALNRLKKKA